MKSDDQIPVGIRAMLFGWIAATWLAGTVLSIAVAIQDDDGGLVILASLIILPFALIVTSPALIVRFLMPVGIGPLGFTMIGACVGLALGIIPDMDLTERDTIGGWLLLAVAGGSAGAVWYAVERWANADAE